MSSRQLTAEAEKTVAKVLKSLPPDIRALAQKVPVIYYDWPTEEILGDEFDPDILGMFVGEAHDVTEGLTNAVPAHILLFLENIADEAEGELQRYREEVRITYLHELGHYLGWDEDDLEARGLD